MSENDDGGAEHAAAAEMVGHPAAGRDKHRQADQIGGQRHAHMQRVGVKTSRHRRQAGRDHRGIHILHEQGGGHDHGGQPHAAIGDDRFDV
jgi:hypothetical protein